MKKISESKFHELIGMLCMRFAEGKFIDESQLRELAMNGIMQPKTILMPAEEPFEVVKSFRHTDGVEYTIVRTLGDLAVKQARACLSLRYEGVKAVSHSESTLFDSSDLDHIRLLITTYILEQEDVYMRHPLKTKTGDQMRFPNICAFVSITHHPNEAHEFMGDWLLNFKTRHRYDDGTNKPATGTYLSSTNLEKLLSASKLVSKNTLILAGKRKEG